jgi:hypothetical protein
MRSPLPKFHLCAAFCVSILLFGGVSNSQEIPRPASGEPQTSRPQVSVAKKLAPRPEPAANEDDLDKTSATEPDKDSPEQIRKRAEWFYKQRSSVKGHIPAGARFNAFQHMQRMMIAEGKLVRRPDGSYAELAPQSWLTPQSAVTSAWSSIGPTPTTGGFFSPVTGRVMTIAVDPSDASGNTVLIGGAMGGIWRSTDAGATWTAVGDQNASLAMGSIAFANPSSPGGAGIVYAGTGEQALAFDTYYGAGVLKSGDHGQTWTQTCTVAGPTCPFIGPYTDGSEFGPGFGFLNFGGAHISYVAVSPSNPNMILVGAQFIEEGPREGVYCSDNGGSTWTNVLADQMSTFVGFASSSVAYAALGNPFGSSPNAPIGNGIFKATGIGSTCSTIHFSRLTAATLPLQSSMGRIDLGIAPSDASGNTVYASIADTGTGSATNLGVFVTADGGTSWARTTAPDVCQHQCWYDNVVKVDPTNKNIVYVGGSSVSNSTAYEWVMRSTGGTTGGSFSSVLPVAQGPGLPHVDVHAITLFKASSGKVRAYLGNDGGIWRTDDAEASTVVWTNLNNPSLTLTQFYPSISINPSSPSIAFGGTQDNGSQNYQGGTNWLDNQLCGDGASSAVDFLVPSTVYIGCATGAPINASYQNGAVGTFAPAITGIDLADTADFIPPLATDPNNANVVYFGTSRVYQSVDAGNTWIPLSAPLVNSGGDWLTAIAVEPGNPKVVYTGSSAGELFAEQTVTTDGNPPSAFFQVGGFPIAPRAVTAIAVDPTDPTGNSAYVALSGFSFNGTDPFGVTITDVKGHIFKTTNANQTSQAMFTDLSCSTNDCSKPAAADLPNIPVNDIVLDPDVPGIIYAATDLGVYVGNCTATPCTWSTLGTGLPNVAVLSLRLHEASRTLRAATHGRGAWDIFLNNFSFTGPRIFSLSPASANSGGAPLTLTVNGTGLTGGKIQFNGTALTTTPSPVQPDAQLSAQVSTSLLVAGTPKITVQVTSATSNALTFPVLAAVPTLTAINPPSTPVQTNPTTSVPIQLTGTGFASSAKVLFNGLQNGITVAAPTTSCPLPTCLSATLPAALLGPFGSTNDIAVLNTPPGGGQSKPVSFRVAAPPPPNDNFANATNIRTLTFNDVQDSSSATTEATDPVPPCANQYTSAQGNNGGHPNGTYNTIWYKFTPIFASNLSVDTIGSSYDSILSIWTGSGTTEATLTATSVACNDDIVQGVNIQSQLSNVPLAAGTTYYIMVSSFGPPDSNSIALGGKSQFNFSYNFGNYPSPVLTSISPTSANSGDPAFTLTINGSNFFNGAILNFDNSVNSLGAAVATTYISPTQLTAVIPASLIALPGPFTVLVLSPPPNYAPSNSLNFTVNLGTYPVPTLSFISPTTVIAGSFPFQLIATGSNFAPSAILNFNGVAQTTSVAPSAQNAYAVISTTAISTSGTVQVTVSNPTPGGGPSAAQLFVITQPTAVPNIASVNPATLPGGIPTNFTVNGTGFTQGATFNVGGPSGNYYSTNFVSSTQLSLPNFAVNGVGTFPVYVIDPAPAGTSAAFNLIVTQPPPPAITSISPTSAQSGSTVNLTITGTNFQPGANVMFNNQSNFIYFTTWISTTQLTTNLVLGGVSTGTYPLVVVNPVPSSTPSAPFNFIVTGPPDFSITSSGTTTQTVPAGQTAAFANAISIAAQNGFSAQVNLSCALPFNATSTTCSVNPPSFASGSGTASVMVTTMARGAVPPSWPRMRFISRPQFLPIFLLTILLSALLLRFARTRRQRFAGALPLAILVLLLTMEVIGCGSGGYTSPPPPPPPTGTPAGTYTITVTATSGTLTHTSTLTLTVQ